jgi:hypothetical protein
MAMRNDGFLPEWCVVEAYQDHNRLSWGFRIGIRCEDADVKILDVEAHELIAPGRSARLHMTKRALLRALHETITVELAKEILEKE